ncbi:MAG: hypothetical protein JJ899_13505 [Alphaproteobacteria bacterium]|nr:hypothetical protein [Alphaproteobacteria bacterium]
MASFYIHDGASGNGRPLPPTQGNSEVAIPLSHTVSDEATGVEVWLRLVAPSGGDIDVGRIEIVRLEISEPDSTGAAR